MFISKQKILIKNLINDIGKENIFFLILLFLLFLSINSGVYHLKMSSTQLGYLESHNYTTIENIQIWLTLLIHRIRYLASFIIFPITIYLFYKKKYVNNLFLNIFILYILTQVITFFYYFRDANMALHNSPLFLDSFQLLMNVVSTLLIINLIKDKKKILSYFFIFMIIFFVSYSCFFLIKLIPEYFGETKKYYLYASSTLQPNTITAGQVTPRITGIARICLIIYFFCISYIYFKKNINSFIYFLFGAISVVYLFLIYGMQSRGSLVGLICFSFIFLIMFKLSIKKKFLYLILLVVPILVYEIPFKNFIDNRAQEYIGEAYNFDVNNRIITGLKLNNYDCKNLGCVDDADVTNRIITGLKLNKDYLNKSNDKTLITEDSDGNKIFIDDNGVKTLITEDSDSNKIDFNNRIKNKFVIDDNGVKTFVIIDTDIDKSKKKQILARDSKRALLITRKNADTYTSGRLELWGRSMEIIKARKLYFGFGPQADRYLLSQRNIKAGVDPVWGTNVSNALVYSLLSAGLIGLIFIFITYAMVTNFVFRSLFRKRLKPMDFFTAFSISVLTFMAIRSLFENGFTTFGIDFFLFVTSYYYLQEDLV